MRWATTALPLAVLLAGCGGPPETGIPDPSSPSSAPVVSSAAATTTSATEASAAGEDGRQPAGASPRGSEAGGDSLPRGAGSGPQRGSGQSGAFPELSDSVTYVVRRGDTVHSISEYHGISMVSLMLANSMENALLAAGDRLMVPPPGQFTGPESGAMMMIADSEAGTMNLRNGPGGHVVARLRAELDGRVSVLGPPGSDQVIATIGAHEMTSLGRTEIGRVDGQHSAVRHLVTAGPVEGWVRSTDVTFVGGAVSIDPEDPVSAERRLAMIGDDVEQKPLVLRDTPGGDAVLSLWLSLDHGGGKGDDFYVWHHETEEGYYSYEWPHLTFSERPVREGSVTWHPARYGAVTGWVDGSSVAVHGGAHGHSRLLSGILREISPAGAMYDYRAAAVALIRDLEPYARISDRTPPYGGDHEGAAGFELEITGVSNPWLAGYRVSVYASGDWMQEDEGDPAVTNGPFAFLDAYVSSLCDINLEGWERHCADLSP